MSSARSYSKESRSYYSRSASFSNDHSSYSSSRRRPLSSLLMERDFSLPSSTWDHFDDPLFFENRSKRFFDDYDRRLRWRCNDDFFDSSVFPTRFENNFLDIERNIPISYRNNSSITVTRNIPVQSMSSSTNRRERIYTTNNDSLGWATNPFRRNNDNFQKQENRIKTNGWLPQQENPKRVRTSMTIFIRPPRVQYSDGSHHQQTTSTTNYPPIHRTYYY